MKRLVLILALLGSLVLMTSTASAGWRHRCYRGYGYGAYYAPYGYGAYYGGWGYPYYYGGYSGYPGYYGYGGYGVGVGYY